MKRLGILLAFSGCAPAFAGGHHGLDEMPSAPRPEEVFFAEPGPLDPEGSVGIIRHVNEVWSSPTRQFYHEVDTPFGTVRLEQTITPNIDCVTLCPDTLEVIDLPAGLAAVPMQITTPERGVEEIVLYPLLSF